MDERKLSLSHSVIVVCIVGTGITRPSVDGRK